MNQYISQFALVVKEYDEAIAFYTETLGFSLIEDTTQSDTKRWVVVRPPGEGSCSVLLAKAVGEMQENRIGNQTGGRVFLFLQTDDFWRDFRSLESKGVRIVRQPSVEEYGSVAIFADLYGNLWDLIGPAATEPDQVGK